MKDLTFPCRRKPPKSRRGSILILIVCRRRQFGLRGQNRFDVYEVNGAEVDGQIFLRENDIKLIPGESRDHVANDLLASMCMPVHRGVVGAECQIVLDALLLAGVLSFAFRREGACLCSRTFGLRTLYETTGDMSFRLHASSNWVGAGACQTT